MNITVQMIFVALIFYGLGLLTGTSLKKPTNPTPNLPPKNPPYSVTPGLVPNLPVPKDVSTGAAVSLTHMFERQNKMEERLEYLENLIHTVAKNVG